MFTSYNVLTFKYLNLSLPLWCTSGLSGNKVEYNLLLGERKTKQHFSHHLDCGLETTQQHQCIKTNALNVKRRADNK